MRTPLLSRAETAWEAGIRAYYQHLTRALGIESGLPEPAVTITTDGAAPRAISAGRSGDGA
jgi:hypothetical protein